MGNAVSDMIKTVDRADEKEKVAKEQLELLMKLADARLDTFEEKLNRMFIDKESASKMSVPGKRALRFERSVRVDTGAQVRIRESINDRRAKRTTQGAPGVEQAVDAFFGAADTGMKGVLDGFKAVVKTGLKVILGDTSAGESYDEKFFVCIKHNAIIRVDMYTYRYNFNNEGVIATHKNVLAYILCVSVVDHRDVTADEIVYLASEFAGDEPEQYEAYLNRLIRVWNNLQAGDFTKKAIAAAPVAEMQKLAITAS
ncbi:hypothetical protein CVT26_013850 [Gymnopilus dilepis]|uniref:Uncharacterized protein n=1 Tax=Gymnopilus dilepis TaxID=231916 RepID=A0A409VVU3_9AGAR|nr:hypothetical protein CVT26_013850 [Gymnopilus dilepis]